MQTIVSAICARAGHELRPLLAGSVFATGGDHLAGVQGPRPLWRKDHVFAEIDAACRRDLLLRISLGM
jgi:hypothetical protein